jgi:hypothetical protein
MENGYTALMYAIQTRNMRSVRYLIARGADVNAKGDDGRSALHLAAEAGNTEVFSLLLQNNAKSHEADYSGKNALDYTPEILKNQFELIIARNSPDYGSSLLRFVENGRVNAVNLLIDQGAEVNIRNKDGDTPLIIATKNNDPQMVSLLLSRGASTLPVNNIGDHALGIAQKLGYIDLAKIIDTVNIKRELESGTTSKTLQMIEPAKPVAAKMNEDKSDKPRANDKAVSSVEANVDLVNSNKEKQSDTGFFSSIYDAITSPATDSAAKVTSEPVIKTEALPALDAGSTNQMIYSNEKVIKPSVVTEPKSLPPGVVKKKVIRKVTAEEGVADSNDSGFLSIFPNFSD